jgi:cyanate lyase
MAPLPAAATLGRALPEETDAMNHAMTRAELTEKIIHIKIDRDLTWKGIAEQTGLSKEFTTAALLGQMALPPEAAQKVGDVLDLNEYEVKLLQQVPYRGALGQAVPTDPLIYRFYELVQVYGTTFKALIEEEFGDGIMSAIDFNMDITREPDPKGDRVAITMSGRFLKYKQY